MRGGRGRMDQLQYDSKRCGVSARGGKVYFNSRVGWDGFQQRPKTIVESRDLLDDVTERVCKSGGVATWGVDMEQGVEEFDRRMVDMGKVGKRVGWLVGCWLGGSIAMTDKEEEGEGGGARGKGARGQGARGKAKSSDERSDAAQPHKNQPNQLGAGSGSKKGQCASVDVALFRPLLPRPDSRPGNGFRFGRGVMGGITRLGK